MYSREKQNPYRKPNVHGKIENVAGSVWLSLLMVSANYRPRPQAPA
jgi:hypothetical protein